MINHSIWYPTNHRYLTRTSLFDNLGLSCKLGVCLLVRIVSLGTQAAGEHAQGAADTTQEAGQGESEGEPQEGVGVAEGQSRGAGARQTPLQGDDGLLEAVSGKRLHHRVFFSCISLSLEKDCV